MQPVRIQRSRQHKQASPNGLEIKFVGRPTKWGNPYKIGMDKYGIGEVHTRQAVIELFEIYANKMLEIEPDWLKELRGKNLSCWCPLEDKCHADILLELANKP
jgi:hypothetical protein